MCQIGADELSPIRQHGRIVVEQREIIDVAQVDVGRPHGSDVGGVGEAAGDIGIEMSTLVVPRHGNRQLTLVVRF